MVYFPSQNPYQKERIPNAIFTFTRRGLFVIDFDTGNFIPSTEEVILCTASVEQAKDPNLTIQSGVDYSRIYFVGHLINPKVMPLARQEQSVTAVINGIEGKFDFISIFDNVESQNIGIDLILGQRIAGYFTSVGSPIEPVPSYGILAFSAASYSVSETGTAIIPITIVRTSGSNGEVGVVLTPSDGTAISSIDFDNTPILVTLQEGETSKTVEVPIFDNLIFETDKTINLTLSDPLGNATLGSQITAVLTIVEDEVIQNGVVSFYLPSYEISETGVEIVPVSLIRLEGSDGSATVTLTLSGGTAIAGEHYDPTPILVTFAQGETTKFVSMPIVNNLLFDGDRTVNLTLSNPTNGMVLGVPSTAILTIIEDELPVYGVIEFSALNYSVEEDSAAALITLVRTGGSDGEVGVELIPSDITAIAPGDYDSTPILVIFADGETSKIVVVPINDDGLFEQDETIQLSLINPTGGVTIGELAIATLTIISEDPAQHGTIAFTTSFYSVFENNIEISPITLIRTGGSDGEVSVTLIPSNGTAIAPQDFNNTPIVVTFANGETTKTVAVPINDNPSFESNKNLILVLVNPTGGVALGSQTTAVLTIVNDDLPQRGVISFSAANYSVNEDGTTIDPIIVNRTNGSDGIVSVTIIFSGGTAGAPNDFNNAPITITFGNGETSKVVAIPIVNDGIFEADETVTLTLSNPTEGAVLGNLTTSVLTIVSEDLRQPGIISFTSSSYSVSENGTTINPVTLSRVGGSDGIVTVVLTPSNNTAIAPGDFDNTPITVAFADGETSKIVTIPINNDGTFEGNETINLSLSQPTNGATLGNLTIAILTIVENDLIQQGVIEFSAASYSVDESGFTVAPVILIRNNSSNGSASVTVTLGNGTATSPQDFSNTPFIVTFAHGETTKIVSLPILDDAIFETNETVILTLSNPIGAVLGNQTTATVTIINNDLAQRGVISFNAANYSVNENGTTINPVTLVRTGGSDGAVAVTLTFSDETTTALEDYEATPIIVTFLNGETIKTVDIPVIDDEIFESNETVNLALSNPTGGVTIGTQSTATLTIISDDVINAGTIEFNSVNYFVSESNNSASITLIRTNGNDGDVTVTLTLSNGTATAPDDYLNYPITVEFADKQTVKTVNVPIIDDLIFEGNETILLNLSNPTGWATLGTRVNATLTILENEFAQQGSISFSSANYSVNELDLSASIELVRNNGSDGVVSVTLIPSNNTAISPNDFDATPIVVTFGNGEISKIVAIPIVDDAIFENAETVTLTLSNPTGGVELGNQNTAILTIVSNDIAQPGIIFFSTPTYFANENAGIAAITLNRTGGSDGIVTVTILPSGDTATDFIDFDADPIVVAFGNGQTSKTVNISITNDAIFENNETVNLTLSSPTGGATIGTQSTATLTIISDDAAQRGAIAFSSTSYSVNENNTTTTPITVIRTGGSDGIVTVVLTPTNGTATAPGDFDNTPITITFGNGETSKTVTIPIVNDAIFEANETVTLTLSNPTGGATLGTPVTATLTIISDDAAQPGIISFTSSSYSVNENNTTTTPITLVRTGGSDGIVTVLLTPSNGTATSPGDFDNTPITITFGNGETSKTVTIPIVNDAIFEANETVTLTLSTPTGGATLGTPITATLTIVSDDAAQPGIISFTSSSYSVNENGTTTTPITVVRTGGSDGIVTVLLTPSNQTAVAPNDFDDTPITITFGNGETSKTVTIPIVNDVIFEANETLSLTLSNPTGGATLGTPVTATLTIISDDVAQRGAIAFSSTSYSVNEDGTTTTPITVVRTGGSDGIVTVVLTPSNQTAVAPNDFDDTPITITFGNGETSKTVTIPIVDDAIFETNETVTLTLSNPTGGATLGTPVTATLTIVSDDAAQPGIISFTSSSYSVNENNTTTTPITLVRTGGSDGIVTVLLTPSNGTATSPGDFDNTPITITFGNGETSKTVTVPIVDDAIFENDETINLTLSNPTGGATIGTQSTATLTIVSDEIAQPGIISFTLPSYSVNENGTASNPVVLTRTNGSDTEVSVTLTLSNGTAIAPGDFNNNPIIVTFGHGEINKTVNIPIVDDNIFEPNETISLTLSDPTNGATLGTLTTATLTIVSDDAAKRGSFEFSAASYFVNEDGTTDIPVTINRINGSDGWAGVSLTPSNNTAIAPGDFDSTPIVVYFLNGQTSKTVSIPIVNDALFEGDEIIDLTLSNPTNGATLGAQTTATLTIVSDDVAQKGVLEFNSATYSVSESSGLAAITITRSSGSDGNVSVTLTPSNGSAIAPADFNDNPIIVNFSNGEISKTVNVPIVVDSIAEGNETVVLTLSNPTNGATLGTRVTATLTIVDNTLVQHGIISFSANSYSINEDNTSINPVTLIRTNGNDGTVTVTLTPTNGTATAPGDFDNTPIVVTFSNGETSKVITVPIVDDAIFESNETVNLALSNPTGGATIGNPSTATLTIVSDDAAQPGIVAFNSPTYSVNEDGTTTTPITLIRTGGSDGLVGITVILSNGTATDTEDYNNTPIVVTFSNGETSKVITVPIVDDAIFESNETVNLALSNPTGGVTIGTQSTATLTIISDDVAQPGVIAFNSPTYSVNENGTTTTPVTLVRTGGSDGLVTVTLTPTNGTATAPGDFDNTPIVVTFSNGETSKVITIPIVDDAIFENNETINLTLSSPTGGVTIGTQSSATLTIISDDVAQPGVIAFNSPTYSVNENGTTTTPVTLIRTGGSDGLVTVTLTPTNGTATAPGDFDNTPIVVTFSNGETSKVITIPIVDDAIFENNETINLTLSSPTGGVTIGTQSTATLTIISDDAAQPGVIAFNSPTYSVNEDGTTTTPITLIRTGGSDGLVTVTLTPTNETATAPGDFDNTPIIVTFDNGETNKTVIVPIVDDAIFEFNETINLTLSNPTGGVTIGTQSVATLTIISNDAAQPGVIEFSSPTYSVDENGTTITPVTLIRTGGSDTQVNVTLTPTNGTATAPGDFDSTPIIVTFAHGETNKTVVIPIVDDAIFEFNETVNLALSNPTGGATIGTQSTATLTIISNDVAQPGVIEFSSPTYSVNENGTAITPITLIRTGGSDTQVNVTLTLTNGTATAPGDFNNTPILVTFAHGETNKTVDVPIVNDAIFEGNETINLSLSDPTNGALLGTQITAILTIVNDDAPQPGVIAFNSPTYSVNEDGTTTTPITLIRTGGSDTQVNVTLTPTNGTATAPGDYDNTPIIVTFAEGETSKTVTIPIVDDTIFENNETINLTLSNPTGGATIGSQSTATLTVINDDAAQPGVISFTSASYSVNENGTVINPVTVTRTNGSDGTVTVTLTPTNGTAISPGDFDNTPIVVTFSQGEVSKTVGISIVNDASFEGDETINLTLSNPTGGATLGTQVTAILTIVNDDVAQPGVIAFNSSTYSVNEDGTTSIPITVVRTGGSDVQVGVTLTPSNGTATAPGDYNNTPIAVTFNQGETSKVITVPIVNDAVFENNETIILTLSNPTGGATIGSQSTATLTIVNDDAPQRGVISFNSATYSISENGTVINPITLIRTGGSDGQVTVTIVSANGTAIAPNDYDNTAVVVTFADGQTMAIASIPIVNDSNFEADETINLSLSTPTNGATLGSQTTAILTIVNDDAAPQPGVITFNSSTYSVNEDGTTSTPITVVRTNGSDGQVSVTLTPSNGTATAPGDYDNTPITITFNQGETVKTVTIPIVNDAIFENNETINLTLSSPTGGATLGNPSAITAVLTIVDNDVDTAFISTWNTNNTTNSVTANNQVRLPLVSNGAYNFTVEWGDNTSDNITVWNQAQTTHTYASPGSYTVRITGTIVGFRFGNAGDRTKITDISQWGVLRLGNGGNYFHGCTNLTVTATGTLDLTGTTNLSNMFNACTNFNGAIRDWNVTNVTNMNAMFLSAPNFNQPLNNWDVANVTNMTLMFANASNFNQPLNNWKTNKVTGMNSMFQNASRFNQNLSTWCVTLIPTAPSSFDLNTPAWQGKPGTLPQWGTCPNP